MKLSILTVNLNNAQGLLKSVESVVSQTSRDFEYIIIDGGSTDGSVDVIRSFTPIAPGIYTPLPDTSGENEGTRIRGYEGTKEREYESTGGRGNESTGERGNECTRERGNESTGVRGNESTGVRGNESTRERGNEVSDLSGVSNIGVSNKSAIRNPQSAITPVPSAPCPMPHAPCSMPPAPCPIVYWISETDTGIYQAMNKGILVARGEYCQFLNSGDWLAAPEVIGRMLENLPDCSFFYGNVLKQMPKGKTYRDTCGEGNVTMLTLYTGSLNHSPVFIKRSLFDTYGLYDENLRIVSDWKWYVQTIGLHGEQVRYTDLDVVCFDMGGISNANPSLLKKERRQVLEELIPANILADYDAFFKDIDPLKRINRNKVIKWLFWFFERILFKLGK